VAEAGWSPPDRVDAYRRIGGFRNVLVHGYLEVRVDVVREVLVSRLDDLLELVRILRSRLDA
jgi:uncharacterized protein YutE (UPF0331/DUF86 family)